MTGRPRRFDDDRCIRCRTRPRARRMRNGKRELGSYCRTCRRLLAKESRIKNQIAGDHARFAWHYRRPA